MLVVVRTFRSARRSRPEGLHYSDFFTGSILKSAGLPAVMIVLTSPCPSNSWAMRMSAQRVTVTATFSYVNIALSEATARST